MSSSKQSNSNRIVSILLSILLALCAHTAWSQAAPPFSITGSQQLSAQINGNTSPAVTVFNNQLLTLWCDQQTGNFSSSLQPTPTATPTQYNTGIVCLHSGNPVAASGIALTVDTTHNIVYAASELFGFCTGSCSPVLLTSTDGINWSSHIININDLVFSYGFGIAYFQGQLYFAYVGQQWAIGRNVHGRSYIRLQVNGIYYLPSGGSVELGPVTCALRMADNWRPLHRVPYQRRLRCGW